MSRSEALHLDSADLVCFSHLRWDFVFQRPQHLLTRFARRQRVFFVEEPVFRDQPTADVTVETSHGVNRVVSVLPTGLSEAEVEALLRDVVDDLMERCDIQEFVAWYYTPMALPFTDHLRPCVTVYDCMDELTGFAGASQRLGFLERRLLQRSDLVFTGGHALYEAKRNKHHHIYPFPSSIDRSHFARARRTIVDPVDQAGIPHPRVGYYGVIDERLDRELLAEVARRRPDWHIVMIGPVAKIDPSSLPRNKNIHYLGQKDYEDLPAYLGGWDVAMMPFVRDQSTAFISPTKTPEYLAGGVPVVSTSIRDVINPYGRKGLVEIADDPADFVRAIEGSLHRSSDEDWRKAVDCHLADLSWDSTWRAMYVLIARAWSESRAQKLPARGSLALVEANL